MKKVFVILALFLFLLLIGKGRVEEPNWDTALVPIIIQIESNGNPNAVSKDGCIGLMQISEQVLEEFNKHYVEDMRKIPGYKFSNFDINGRDLNYINKYDLYNYQINELVGTWYLKRIWLYYLSHYKIPQTIDNLLIAYNFGIGNLVKYRQGKVKLPYETRQYIKKYHKLAK